MLVIHHDEIRRRIKPRYSREDVDALLAFLLDAGAFRFTPLASGLFPAAGLGPAAAADSGYGNVWVRDNIYVALAHEAAGRFDVVIPIVQSMAAFYRKYQWRFWNIISGKSDPNVIMNRPHVRFDGLDLTENAQTWAHAQNDALGYFLWMYCRLIGARRVDPDLHLVALFVRYFDRIAYWRDEDSGHWEEARKVEASSIGAVLAGLLELRKWMPKFEMYRNYLARESVSLEALDRLIDLGKAALEAILPAESPGSANAKARRYDAALLFLVYPLEVVDDAMADQILGDVAEHLQGDYGIRRYPGDSYWTADYKAKLPPSELTSDFSERQQQRDALARPGEEAQWCIFDPIVSIAAARRYQRTGDAARLDRQASYLNRSLAQITGPECKLGALRCPEAYYLERGRYVPNDHVPLLWTQANLWNALLAMKVSAEFERGASESRV